jgi:monovalent cation:H+ antiporter, CPA1 family
VRAWQIVAAVAAGIIVGAFEPGRFEYALGHATLYVFLPPLLFEAAWNLKHRIMARHWPAIALLAGPGVVLTALIVAGALAVVRVPFGPALLTGAILSATDPIAVIAVFRRIKVPMALATIVECESLFNDALAVVLYRGILAALALGTIDSSAFGRITVATLAGALGGVALGIGGGFTVARLLRRSTSVVVQILATIACAYGAYFAADALQLSGIFATIACGIALRYYERAWITLSIAEDVIRFWDLAALLANGVVFFLVGAALQLGQIAREPIFIITCLIAIAISRAVVAGLLLPGGYPREWIGVVRVAGVRGALCIALSLAIPPSVAYRQPIVDAAFAVAIATLLAGSLAVTRVARRAVR